MVEAMVITLREGIEAALVVGIILAYLQKSGRLALRRYVYWGLGLAVLASLAVAALFQTLGFDPENEYLEGALLGIAGLFVASMVIWMWRTSRHIRAQVEDRLTAVVAPEEAGRRGLGLMAFTFVMVFREGVETVLFLAAIALEQFSILSLVGATVGLGLAVLFAVLFIRGTLRVNLARFFAMTGIILLVLAAKLLAGSVHEFAEVGLIPMTASVMQVLGYLVRDRATTLILMALFVLPLVMVLWGSKGQPSPEPRADSAAQRRQVLAQTRRERTWRLALGSSALAVILIMASSIVMAGNLIDPTPQPVAAQAGEIQISTAGWEAGSLHKFAHTLSQGEVRFLAVKLEDGSISTAFDACRICGWAGYMQEGRNLICKNCNAPIPMDTLGLGGGCNPIALKSRMQGDSLIINEADLTSILAVKLGKPDQ